MLVGFSGHEYTGMDDNDERLENGRHAIAAGRGETMVPVRVKDGESFI